MTPATLVGGSGGSPVYEIIVQNAPTVKGIINKVNISLGNTMLATWMEGQVVPYFQEQMINRFATNGGRGVDWAPLQESTKRIRREMGQSDDYAINDRTGEMLETLVSQYHINQGPGVVEMRIPGNDVDELTEEKLRTAQYGKTEANPLFGGTVTRTPARPVLLMDEYDRRAVMLMLQQHVIHSLSKLLTLGSLGSL